MTIDKQLKDVKEWQEKNSLTINEIDKNVKTIMKSGGGGSADLTKIESSLTSVENKITSIESGVETNNSNLNSQTDKINTINNNITTINSNTATTNNNVNTIKSDVEKIKSGISNTYFNNKVEQSLDRILNYVNSQQNIDVFVADPYALDLPYTEKLTTNRNSTNKDYYSIDEEFTAHDNCAFFIGLIYCAGTTMGYNYTMSFTCESAVSFKIMISNKKTQTFSFEAGTHQFVLKDENHKVVDNKSIFLFINTGNITVHNIQIELTGEQIIFLNKPRKFHLSYSPNSIIINKVENFKGYHLVLNSKESLTPDMIQKPYNLMIEKVFSYGMNYLMYSIFNEYVPYGEYKSYVDLAHEYHANYKNGYYTRNGNHYFPVVYSYMGHYSSNYLREGTILTSFSGTTRAGQTFHSYNTSDVYSYTDLQTLGTNSCILVSDISRFDRAKRLQFVIETFNGDNYLLLGFGSTAINIGFGKNATAFWDTQNELLVHIYLNDNGYCVKKDYLLNEDKTSAQLLSQKIIGTYDYYFETNSDVYFVVKNDELLMFKKNFPQNEA